MKVERQDKDNPVFQIRKALSDMRPDSHKMCLTCKGGRLLCGASYCPIIQRISLKAPYEEKLSQDVFGPSPGVFVGWKGYPNVNVGPMAGVDAENPWLLNDPGKWYGLDFNDIIELRFRLIRSKSPENVKSSDRYVLDTQELALSVKPTDIEAHYKKKPSFGLSFSPISQPMGPSGDIEKLRITENTLIPRTVDSIVSDELKSTQQAVSLYDKNFDVYYLTNVLSSGALGMKSNRKMVPTRWSITAVDDMLGKHLMKRIRDYPHLNDIRVYSNTYLENHFEILLIPGGWEFEQFEAWAPDTLWTMGYDEPVIAQEHEGHAGRWEYALNEGGGYYAGRLAVCEGLERLGRQARAVVFREIHEGYIMPVGVWEVRENVRHAFLNRPTKFSSLREALKHIDSVLRIPVRNYIQRSDILQQSRIVDYT